MVRISQGMLLGVDILRQMSSGRDCCLRFKSCIKGVTYIGNRGFRLLLSEPNTGCIFPTFRDGYCKINSSSLPQKYLWQRADLQAVFVPLKDNGLTMSDEKYENTKKSEMLMVLATLYTINEAGFTAVTV